MASRPTTARFGAKSVAGGGVGGASDHGVATRDSEVLAVVRLHCLSSKDKWWSVRGDGSCWNTRLEDATHDAFAFRIIRGGPATRPAARRRTQSRHAPPPPPPHTHTHTHTHHPHHPHPAALNNNPDAVTFESVLKPNFVLACDSMTGSHSDTGLTLVDRGSFVVADNSDTVSFLVQEVCDMHGRLRRGWVSFQSCSAPESYVRQRSGRIRCEEESGAAIARLDGTFELLERPDFRRAVDVHTLRRRADEATSAEGRGARAEEDDPTTIVWAASMEMSIGMLRVTRAD